ncbi:MAG TPA: diaminopimelate decarboxylase [Candidatus Saccharimonadales bacterium]|nr:diaminopimelate decarboxylase [Candidatus Saccharimonadales bacterium]
MADHVGGLIEKFFPSSGGEVHVGGVPVTAVVAECGTPLFIYDRHVLDTKWDLLRRTFPAQFEISYSVKANPNIAILRYFLSKGCGLEIASGGEFYLALNAGCAPDKILFAGPGKTEADLEFVLTRGIGEIHIESPLELQRISAISRRLDVHARVAVRVNPSAEAQGGAMRMGGKPAPFGIDEETLDEVIGQIALDPCLEFRGIHLFTGTQILDHKVLIRQYRKGLQIALRVAQRLQRPLRTVDFGGGLGIPYFAGDHELNLELLDNELKILMREVREEPLFSGTRFMLEPGRYLVGEAGIYVAQIIDIKTSRGKKFLVLDGGMNHHLAASGNLGQVIKKNFPIAILNKMNVEPQERVDVVGPLCTPLDVLARDAHLPVAEVGDLLGVFQSGAYARSASPLEFLSHPSPAEVLTGNGQFHLIRRRGTHDDLLARAACGL